MPWLRLRRVRRLPPRRLLRSFLIVGGICTVRPDIDAVGRPFSGGRGDLGFLGGHRGFTHSLTYAVLIGLIAMLATVAIPSWKEFRVRFDRFVGLSTAAHGALDALSSVGATTSPVQFFSPFSTRYTAPWHPIHGPFSELFLCLLALLLVTRLASYRRGIPWPWRQREEPVRLGLAGYPVSRSSSVIGLPGGSGRLRRDVNGSGSSVAMARSRHWYSW